MSLNFGGEAAEVRGVNMKKMKPQREKRRSTNLKPSKRRKVLSEARMSKTGRLKDAIFFFPVLLLILLVPGVWVYGQEEEGPKPMPAVPQDYRDKHMPDGWWTNPSLMPPAW